jgi:hypothetical protein
VICSCFKCLFASACAPARAAAAPSASGTDPLLALIGSQECDEPWADIQKLKLLCGVNVNCRPALACKEPAFATALAIAVLRVKLSDRKNEWKW